MSNTMEELNQMLAEPHHLPLGRQFRCRNTSTGTEISVTPRQQIFQGNYSASGPHPEYDVDRTGKFVLLQPVGGDEIVVMLNAVNRLLSPASPTR